MERKGGRRKIERVEDGVYTEKETGRKGRKGIRGGWNLQREREREECRGVWDEGREIESSPRPSLTTPLSAAWPLCQASCTKRRFLAAIAGATVYVYVYIYIYYREAE